MKKIYRILIKAGLTLAVTGMLCLIGGLGLEYVLVKGPSAKVRDTFVLTMLETRRFGFIPRIFLSEEEVEAIRLSNSSFQVIVTDTSLIDIPASEAESLSNQQDYGLIDEDGDGLILEKVNGRGYTGYMLIVLDPSRVCVGKPPYYGEVGQTVGQMCDRYGAVAAINAGGFLDIAGMGLGGMPMGLTVVNGEYYNTDAGTDSFAGFDYNNILHVGYMGYWDAVNNNIRDGVTFGPVLVANGQATAAASMASGINPRTAIGQRADGAVLMLVIDGRQAQSVGATYSDVADVMLDYGAVNACNMDGGSSTSLYMNGEYVNSCSAATGVRPLPTCFLVR